MQSMLVGCKGVQFFTNLSAVKRALHVSVCITRRVASRRFCHVMRKLKFSFLRPTVRLLGINLI
jgi:hypothetical protein